MPIFILINDILCVCILLICHLWFITTMFMREGDQVKPWSPVQFLAIRSSLVSFALFYFEFLKPKNHLKPFYLLLLLWFGKLASYWCLAMIRLKRIYNFWCSMLVLHQLLCVLFTLRGIFLHFPELTYWRDATVPVPCFLLFLCFRKVT
jgi:hypothetical protein